MIAAGVDVGNRYTKAVMVEDGQVLSKGIELSGFDQKAAVEAAYGEALRRAGLDKNDVNYVVATGAGRGAVTFADTTITEVNADVRGAIYLIPTARTIIDVGVEESRCIRCDERGRVLDFAVNERCAAGAGAFIEAMARALEVGLEELGTLSLEGDHSVRINAQCTVFAESEVVSLIHARTPKPAIARAIHEAIASRIISMAQRVGVARDVVLIGGMAYNIGFVDALRRGLDLPVFVPQEPAFVGALGAALAAKK